MNGTHLFALSTQFQSNARNLPSNPILLSPKPTLFSSTPKSLSSNHLRKQPLSAAAAAESLDTSNIEEEKKQEQAAEAGKKLGVVVKGLAKPRLVLKFLWMEKNIGLALDQVIPGYGSVPLSPYYFWPRKDAWEELKSKLEEKPWISQKRIIILLNQATDIINLWQQSGGSLSS